MPLSCSQLVERLWDGTEVYDPTRSLAVVPSFNNETLRAKNAASLDLRLGRWFRSMRQSRVEYIAPGDGPNEDRITKEHYVRFNKFFTLHPGQFVIGNTLEWLRFPNNLSAYVTGKSAWGRRGLIIETAAGIHPGFTGCLTLELANVGNAPIKLQPGMEICQIFVHQVDGAGAGAKSQFVGFRKPSLGEIKSERISDALGKTYFNINDTD